MYISQALAEHNWNITHTALTLDVSPTTLRKKITDYHLKRAES
jgi:DNA-binding NtrC family response regulator